MGESRRQGERLFCGNPLFIPFPTCTHHNQTHSVLLVGSIGSHDGDHHGNGAHDVEGDEAGDATFELQADRGQVSLRARPAWPSRLPSYLSSSMVADQDVRQQREAEDEPAHHLKGKARPSDTRRRPRSGIGSAGRTPDDPMATTSGQKASGSVDVAGIYRRARQEAGNPNQRGF